jgi:L-rhamnonate dehydratase
MAEPTIRHLRAYTIRGGGADYRDQSGEHWIDDQIASPMSQYPEYRQSRRSFGLDVLGTLDGSVGFALTTGGEIGAYIVEKHLARFVEAAASTILN